MASLHRQRYFRIDEHGSAACVGSGNHGALKAGALSKSRGTAVSVQLLEFYFDTHYYDGNYGSMGDRCCDRRRSDQLHACVCCAVAVDSNSENRNGAETGKIAAKCSSGCPLAKTEPRCISSDAVSLLPSDGDSRTAVIVLENQSTYIVPIEMLPRNIEVDDFVIIENGVVRIDPETDEKKELLRSALENILK